MAGEDPGQSVRVPGWVVGMPGWGQQSRPVCEVVSRLRAALHNRINERGGVDVGDDPDREAAWRRDAIAIREYRTRRVVRRGSGLETEEGRRAAPDVHAAFREAVL
jgi:hypothetical protein